MKRNGCTICNSFSNIYSLHTELWRYYPLPIRSSELDNRLREICMKNRGTEDVTRGSHCPIDLVRAIRPESLGPPLPNQELDPITSAADLPHRPVPLQNDRPLIGVAVARSGQFPFRETDLAVFYAVTWK